jgi:hypothetical protein
MRRCSLVGSGPLQPNLFFDHRTVSSSLDRLLASASLDWMLIPSGPVPDRIAQLLARLDTVKPYGTREIRIR